jgi:N-methylhydantoinase A
LACSVSFWSHPPCNDRLELSDARFFRIDSKAPPVPQRRIFMTSHPSALPQALAMDIGGTFTDVVATWGEAQVRTTKFLSSVCADPQALAGHLTQWLHQMQPSDAAPPDKPTRIGHATTIATNALLEAKTSRTALIATEGFRDVIELGRGIRPDPLDLAWRPLPPVVPRELRLCVHERMASDGALLQPLVWSEAEQQRILARLAGCEAVAICLLNAHANPAHEQQIAAALRQALPQLFITCSHEVNPEPREYERSSTTAINAALGPVVQRYLCQLESGLRSMGLTEPLAVMQSNGGTLSSPLVKLRPVTIVESGPAAGVLAVLGIARQLREAKVIALDIGGTTAKASLVENYEILEAPEYYVGGGMHAGPRAATSSGYVIRMPSLDIAEVGAGGGSIAAVDEAGGLQVGPRSAGASPGPAGYGLGGTAATVTDANILLGYINPEAIANGQQAIHRGLSEAAMRNEVAGPRKLQVEDAALVVHTVANASVLAALRSVTIERGRDPREHLIVAFGGSGPVHAVGIADLLGVSRVLVPFGAGVLSAAGLLAATPAADVTHVLNQPLHEVRREALESHLHGLHERMQHEFHLAREDVDEAQPLVSLRYAGQQTEVFVPMPEAADLAAELRRLFEHEYMAEFGFLVPDGRCEVMGVRLRLRRPPPPDWSAVLQGLGRTWAAPAAGPRRSRRCVFEGFRGDCPVVTMQDIGDAESGVAGPAILETPDTTVVIAPGWRATVHQQIGILLCK